MKLIPYLVLLLFLPTVRPVYADDYAVQFLAAACTRATNADAKVVVTTNGPAVRHRGQSIQDVVIHCPVNADIGSFFDWLQLVAEDNTPDGYAQATLWRVNSEEPAPAELLYTVKTQDVPRVQVAANANVSTTLDVEDYVYWIEIRIVRSSPDAVVTVYSTGLKNL